jgi:polyisoprenoid-binding protein YceI
VDFVYFAPTLAVVAMRAGRYDIRPNVLAAQVAWCHVIYSQIALALTAILASIIVAAKDLAASQLDVWTRPMDLVLQPYH